jgi:hypothetical protein
MWIVLGLAAAVMILITILEYTKAGKALTAKYQSQLDQRLEEIDKKINKAVNK